MKIKDWRLCHVKKPGVQVTLFQMWLKAELKLNTIQKRNPDGAISGSAGSLSTALLSLESYSCSCITVSAPPLPPAPPAAGLVGASRWLGAVAAAAEKRPRCTVTGGRVEGSSEKSKVTALGQKE